MASRATVICLFSLVVWSLSVAAKETCSSQPEKLSAAIKQAAEECRGNLTWSRELAASTLIFLKNLTDLLHQRTQKECRFTEPTECPQPEIPANGGLVCARIDNKHYCKPLCNHGYDFSFLRSSRVYEECNNQTKRWSTQYVGGNRVAVCNKASIQASGTNTAYFPREQDCLTTMSNSQLRRAVLQVFAAELTANGVVGEPQLCLACGRT